MTHDQVRQMVRRVNPIPDPSTLETVAAPVLGLERSMDMQTNKREVVADRGGSRFRGPLIGIAAAAVILVAGAIVIATNQEPVATPAANPTRLIEGDDFYTIDPGAYYVDIDGGEPAALQGTFVIEGTGWSGAEAGAVKVREDDTYTSLFVVGVDRVWEAPCQGGDSVPAGTTTKALADQFAAMPGFVSRNGLSSTRAFGHAGYHIVLEVPEGCTDDTDTVWGSPIFFERYYQAPGQTLEFWFLDVGGAPVMVEASWFPESPQEDVAELRAMLDTLVITP
jgi:hypothetical protein